MDRKNNPENIFVRECITEALIKLIKTKPLSEIRITELTKTAGVSRMSYYRNFNSKEEIFSSYFSIILDRYDAAEKQLYQNGIYYMRSGAGIVQDSIPSVEYIETQNKVRSQLDMLGIQKDKK